MVSQNKCICFFLPSLNIGGVENVFITYANELARRGYDVKFVLCVRVGDLLPLVSDDVIIEDLGNIKLRSSLWKLRNYVKRLCPDIIVTGGDYPNMICVLAMRFLKKKPKIILSKHNYQNVETKELGWWTKFELGMQKFLYPKSDGIIAVSKGISSYLQDELNIDERKILQICNPLDVKDIEIKSQERINIVLPKKYIVFVGRLGKVKNFPLLLEAYKRLKDKDIHLVIVGEGPERRYIEQYVEGENLKRSIHLTGSMSNPMPIIKQSSALVLCSTSEAYPTILLETMAMQVPIVSTPTKGAIEILGNTEGTFISSSFDNADEFSKLVSDAVEFNAPIQSSLVETNAKDKIVNRFIESVGL